MYVISKYFELVAMYAPNTLEGAIIAVLGASWGQWAIADCGSTVEYWHSVFLRKRHTIAFLSRVISVAYLAVWPLVGKRREAWQMYYLVRLQETWRSNSQLQDWLAYDSKHSNDSTPPWRCFHKSLENITAGSTTPHPQQSPLGISLSIGSSYPYNRTRKWNDQKRGQLW